MGGDVFAIIEEREARLSFVTITDQTTNINYPTEFLQLQLNGENPPCENMVGLEGIAFNASDSEGYTVRHSDNNDHLVVIATVEDTDPTNDGDNKRFLIELSTCGNLVSYIDLEAQDYFAEDDPNNIEGITMRYGDIVLIGEGLNNDSKSRRFCLSKYAPPCPINVTEPFFESVYCPGETANIAWAAVGLNGNVNIELVDSYTNSTVGTINNTVNDGTETFTLPSTLTDGLYFFKVSSADDPSCYNFSAFFNVAIPLIGDQIAIWAATDLACPMSGCMIAATTEYTISQSVLTLIGTDVDTNGSNSGIFYKDVEGIVHNSTGSYNFDDIKGSPASQVNMLVDTRGYEDVKLRFDYNSEESKTLDILYSIDGGDNFIMFEDDFSIIWGDNSPWRSLVFDFSGIPAINQNENVMFRVAGLNDNNKDNKDDRDDFKIVNMEVFGTVNNDVDNDGYTFDVDPDDNNPCVPDSYSAECSDCNVLWFSDFENGLNAWEDGGAWCYRQNIPSRSASGNYSVRLRGYGATSNLSILFSMGNYQDADITFSFYAFRMEHGDDLLFQVKSAGSDEFETVAKFVSGVDFDNNAFNTQTVHLNGPFPNFPEFRFQLDGNQAGDYVYLDDIEIRGCYNESGPTCDDGILNGTEEYVDCGGFGCDPCPCEMELPEETCDDNFEPVCGCDDETYDNACEAENEGITEYISGPCPTCDDGILNGDEILVDCGGACGGCNSSCFAPVEYGWEYGYNGWVDGGSDCVLVYGNGFNSDYSVLLRDNTATSTFTSPSFNLNTDFAQVSFTYYVTSFEGAEDFFFERSTDGGVPWDVLGNYVRGVDFQNDERKFVSIDLYSPNANTKFRFRCDASGNGDLLYVDNFSLTECYVFFAPGGKGEKEEVSSRSISESLEGMIIYPNPVSKNQELMVKLAEPSSRLLVLDMGGKVVLQKQLANTPQEFKLPLDGISNGTYILKVIGENKTQVKKFIVME